MTEKKINLVSLGFWILIALGLVVLFNIYPHASGPLIAFAMLLLTAASLFRQYWFGRLVFFKAGMSTVVSYCFVFAGFCLTGYLLWSTMILAGGGTIRFSLLTNTLALISYWVGFVSLLVGLYIQRKDKAHK